MIFWRLFIYLLQFAVLLAWFFSAAAAQYPFLRVLTGIAAVGCAVMLFKLIPRVHQTLLWRRRRSARPSREVQAERRRIAAALHDSVGSQLVQAMVLLESKEDQAQLVQPLLEQSLLDLRLIVDSMDGQDDALSIRLARFRHRLQAVMERRGIALHWDVWDPELSSEPHASPDLPRGQAAHQILFILQEAVSNVLQHAHAKDVWISLAPLAQGAQDKHFAQMQLSVEDNGRGLPKDAQGHTAVAAGMGLANMHERAREIGAQLQVVQRSGGGTQVDLRF